MSCTIYLCCLCLKNNKLSYNLYDKHENLTYYERLSTFLPYLLPELDELKICQKCCKSINAAYEFRQTCIRNINLYKNYMSKLSPVRIKKNVICVPLNDISKNVRLIPDGKTYTLSNQIKITADSVNDKKVMSCEDVNSVENSDNSKKEIQAQDNVVAEMETIYIKQEDQSAEPIYSKGIPEIDRSPKMNTLKQGIDKDLQTEKLICASDIKPEQESPPIQSPENTMNVEIDDQNTIFQQVDCILENKTEEIKIKRERMSDEDSEKEFLHSSEDVEGQLKIFVTHNGKKDCSSTLKARISRVEKLHKCTECKKSFDYACHLKVHMRSHSGETPVKCPECNKSFIHTGHLTQHLRKHTGEKPFKCRQCTRAFSQTSSLKQHMRTHSGERPYSCKECEQTFRQSSVLRNHMRSHTGQRPYQCGECGKTFAQLGHLTGHRLVHTGQKSYKCNQCGQAFRQPGDLKRHRTVHTGEKSFRCTQCHKDFSQRSALKLHHKRFHNEDKQFKST